MRRIAAGILWRLDMIPPKYYWRLLGRFLIYGFKQAGGFVMFRSNSDGIAEQARSLKRAHYLEKAIYSGQDRTVGLDACCEGLKGYICGDGKADPMRWYMSKLVREYEGYPAAFKCPIDRLLPRPPDPETASTIMAAIVNRRSTRRFTAEPVDIGLIERVVDAGRNAPTSCNSQAVLFISSTDRATIDAVLESSLDAYPWAGSVPAIIVVGVDRRPYRPFEQHLVMAQDIAAATQNMLLMAHSLGLGACWITLISDSSIRAQAHLYLRLGAPKYLFLGALVAIGHPASTVCRVPRRPLEQVWFHERLGNHPGVST